MLPSLRPIPYHNQSIKPKPTAKPIIGVVNLNNFPIEFDDITYSLLNSPNNSDIF